MKPGKRLSLAVALSAAIVFVQGCQRDEHKPGPVVSGELVDQRTMAVGETSGPFTVTVPEGAAAFTITADGGDASDMDISNITDPNGRRLVMENPEQDVIGVNLTQGYGQSAVEFTLPHSGDYPLLTGTYTYYVTHYDSVDRQSKPVSIYRSVKLAPGAVIDINVFLVAIPDYDTQGAARLNLMLDRFRTALGWMGVILGEVNIIELDDADAQRLTVIDLNRDEDQNGQADDMDELFRRSTQAGNNYVSFFLVRDFSEAGVLGVAGGIPCPQLVTGTAHSGVTINLFGGFASITSQGLRIQGDTMAHELGHFLGLFHTTELHGTAFDPLSDTPACDVRAHDTNKDGVVSATECENLDGPNLMFWSAAPYAQETFTGMQKYVASLNPALR